MPDIFNLLRLSRPTSEGLDQSLSRAYILKNRCKNFLIAPESILAEKEQKSFSISYLCSYRDTEAQYFLTNY